MEFPSRHYPESRLRRLRKYPWIRSLVEESQLRVSDLIWPLFITEGRSNEAVTSMPGVERHCLDSLLRQVERALELGIPAVALFPLVDPSLKNNQGDEAWNPNNLVCRAIKAIRAHYSEIGVIGDVALDPYTSQGQDGIMIDGYIHNDQSVQALVKQAGVLVDAGYDIIAPSDMMDGRIAAIRQHLEHNNKPDTHLMAYSAKYNSAFYGPFRDAIKAGISTRSGGKDSYQINPPNSDEALHEVAQDIREGADSIIIKPGMPYLDIVQRVKSTFAVPTFAYQVSGEYSMLQMAARANALDLNAVMMESLISFKRAGADGIWTYFAADAAEILRASPP